MYPLIMIKKKIQEFIAERIVLGGSISLMIAQPTLCPSGVAASILFNDSA